MKTSRSLANLAMAATAFALMTPSAWAIPAFARKYNVTCAACHSAVPYLNSTGRSFKEAGWRMPGEDGLIDLEEQPSQEVSKNLWIEKVFPVAARIKGYAFDKKEGSDTKIRPLHEVEVFAAGSFWKTGSFFFEMEGEDEESFEVVLAGEAGWHPHRAANLKAGYGSIFHPDPYNSLMDGGHRLTVSHQAPLDVGSAAKARFRSDAQYITFYGRTTGYGKKNSLFYMLGASGGNDNPEGENPKDFLARAAFDFTPDLMLGGFYFGGSRDLETETLDLSRWGVDFNLRFSDLYLLGMFMNAEEKLTGASMNNNAAYVEALYTLRKDGRPFFVPLLRYDWTELNDGSDTFSAITAQAGFYVVENAKVALEYNQELDVAPGKDTLYRVTLLLDIGF
jgi:hypothetical protein